MKPGAHKFACYLPRDPYAFLGKLLACITDDWQWIDGELRAPSMDKKKFALGVNYVLSRTEKLVGGESNEVPMHNIITSPRRPEFIRFDKAGAEGPRFSHAKRVAYDYLADGYLGELTLQGPDMRVEISRRTDASSMRLILVRPFNNRDPRTRDFKRLFQAHKVREFPA